MIFLKKFWLDANLKIQSELFTRSFPKVFSVGYFGWKRCPLSSRARLQLQGKRREEHVEVQKQNCNDFFFNTHLESGIYICRESTLHRWPFSKLSKKATLGAACAHSGGGLGKHWYDVTHSRLCSSLTLMSKTHALAPPPFRKKRNKTLKRAFDEIPPFSHFYLHLSPEFSKHDR